jgi:hypothetical protein
MTIALNPAQLTVLQETREATTPAEFQGLLDTSRPEMDRVVREVQEPGQPIATALIELRDLSLSVTTYEARLAAANYGPARRALLRDAIRLVATAETWLGEGARTGAFRARPIGEVLQQSRPWRARLKAHGAHAFAFDADLADQFADVNSTGTLEEEKSDLRMLNELVEQHAVPLAAVGMTTAFAAEGRVLSDEANGRDLLGVLGLRNQEEAVSLRNRIITYATLLGSEARAAGVNACFDDPDAKRRFEAISFRHALRRLRPGKRRAAAAATETPAPAPAAVAVNGQPS